jgi:hypothetical protein
VQTPGAAHGWHTTRSGRKGLETLAGTCSASQNRAGPFVN